jgi:hypothetical protein
MPKRVVFVETDEAHRGLHHILGCDDEFDGQTPPDYADIEVRGRVAGASLIRANARYVLYREVLKNEAD